MARPPDAKNGSQVILRYCRRLVETWYGSINFYFETVFLISVCGEGEIKFRFAVEFGIIRLYKLLFVS